MESITETRDKIYDEMRLELHGPNARDNFQRRNEELIQTPQTVIVVAYFFLVKQKLKNWKLLITKTILI